jgi:hypothetical protein
VVTADRRPARTKSAMTQLLTGLLRAPRSSINGSATTSRFKATKSPPCKHRPSGPINIRISSLVSYHVA